MNGHTGQAAGKRVPGATYRLQFNREFTFSQATALAEYWRELGVTDCYASPLFKAGAESTHGYDICSFDQFNPGVGSPAEFDRFAGRLREAGLGLLLDMVPNHMGNELSNRWWLDVLEKGPASPYAPWFDIHWRPLKSDLHDQVLLPTLGDHYAKVLEEGKLQLVFEEGRFALAYYERKFPLSPQTQASLLNSGPNPAAALQRLNGTPGEPRSFDALHALLQQQHYRLACWRVGPEEINYRRFFDITGLVSLRMELPEVFEAAHSFLFCLLQEGKLTGLRIDHPDGLWDPKQYFERLQARAGAPLYVVAEKILTGDEPLPPDWPVDGTTGYDFLNRVNGLFVNPAHQEAFDRLWQAFGGRADTFETYAWEGKRQVLHTSLASELNALTHRLRQITTATRYGLDFTFRQLAEALIEIVAALPVYRTYVTAETASVSGPERAYLTQATRAARQGRARLDPAVIDFLEALLLLRPPADLDETGLQRCREFVLRFQQLTGPVMAKGVEDTAFYRYNRLISLNDVGGEPGRFGISLADFHAYNSGRAARWPHSLLATATHDTKRGEDARMRIDVLSEMPEEWQNAVTRWRALNADKKSPVNGHPAPWPQDEYFLYQTLIGAWPFELHDGAEELNPVRSSRRKEAQTSEGSKREQSLLTSAPTDLKQLLGGFRERVGAYMLKAIREAKAATSWTEPNAAYEQAMSRFVEQLLADPPNPFLDDFKAFHRRVAFFGQFNSLSQVLLKLTSPGVPDIYQGCELWDFSLVDPDNRRPVNYALRRQLLAELKERAREQPPDMPQFLRALLQSSPTGQIKLYLTWRALAFRRKYSALFENGGYVPLFAEGAKRDHVCAFARVREDLADIAVAPRWMVGLTGGKERPPMGAEVWSDTGLPLPEAVPGSRFRNVLTGEFLPVTGQRPGERKLPIDDALSLFPVALLERVQ